MTLDCVNTVNRYCRIRSVPKSTTWGCFRIYPYQCILFTKTLKNAGVWSFLICHCSGMQPPTKPGRQSAARYQFVIFDISWRQGAIILYKRTNLSFCNALISQLTIILAQNVFVPLGKRSTRKSCIQVFFLNIL